MKKLWEYISTDSKLVFFVFDNDGFIKETNDYTRLVIGRNVKGKHFSEIFLDFSQEIKFEEMFSQSVKKLLNVSTEDDLPQSFYFMFLEEDGIRIAIGESDPDESNILRKELLNMNNDLNTMTRTLHKKNAELKKLNDLKNQFLGVAAHDLRNPVGNIIRLSEFLLTELTEKLDDNQKKFLKLIKKLGEYGIGLLNDLLDIVKIESGKFNLNLKPINTITLVKDIIELNKLNSHSKGIDIKLSYFADVPQILADESSFRQILDNLLSNAIKYSPSDSSIEVGLLENQEFITFFVKDQGQGISENDQKKLFQPFSTTGSRTTGGEKSTGLGLTIVQRLVLSYGGKIWLNSKVGDGTTFYFSIPVALEKGKIQ